MSDYQLEIKQVVDYPRCRIYREFVQTLISDRSIRTNGGSGLFYYTVLCSYANFRTSYRGWTASPTLSALASGSSGSVSWRLAFVSGSSIRLCPS